MEMLSGKYHALAGVGGQVAAGAQQADADAVDDVLRAREMPGAENRPGST